MTGVVKIRLSLVIKFALTKPREAGTATETFLPAGSSRTNWNGSLKAYLRK